MEKETLLVLSIDDKNLSRMLLQQIYSQTNTRGLIVVISETKGTKDEVIINPKQLLIEDLNKKAISLLATLEQEICKSLELPKIELQPNDIKYTGERFEKLSFQARQKLEKRKFRR